MINDWNPSVLIMMATYNGEKYLREQLDSIINQSYSNWNLFIQDDGSTDHTWDIIVEYAKMDERIFIQKSPELKHGAYINFHSLANQSKQKIHYDYYMFSDQDDVWFEDKIHRMLSEIKEVKEPTLCYADMKVIDDQGFNISDSINLMQGNTYINAYSVYFSHIVYGCNVIMNKEAFFMVPEIDINIMHISMLSHDNLYTKFAALFGTVHYIQEPLMLYRRHRENVTSRQQYGFTLKRILKRMKNLQELAKDHALTYNQSLIAINIMKKNGLICNQNQVFFVDEIERIICSGGWSSLIKIRNNNISWGNAVKNISHKLIFLCKLYKKYLILNEES